MNHQEMNEFLERLRQSLENCTFVKARVYKNEGWMPSVDPIADGSVEELHYKHAGITLIKIACHGGLFDWEYSKRTPCLEALSDNVYKLYNGPSWLVLEFT